MKNELGKTEEVFYSTLTSAHCVYKNKFMLKLIKRHIGFIITIHTAYLHKKVECATYESLIQKLL